LQQRGSGLGLCLDARARAMMYDRPSTAPNPTRSARPEHLTREDLGVIHERRLDKLVDMVVEKERQVSELERMVKTGKTQLEDSERLRQFSVRAEQHCRLNLETAKEARRTAEVKLAGAEEELATLKAAHGDVNFRVRLDWASQKISAPSYQPSAAEVPPPSLLSWAEGAQLHSVVAAGIQRSLIVRGGSAEDPNAGLEFLKSLDSRQAVEEVICSPNVLDEMINALWGQVQALQR